MSFPLNEDQARAAHTLQGPVLITAGAGTGKTRALTERFVSAVSPGSVPGWTPAPVDEILTITFTDKAAGELSERIRGSLRAAGLNGEARSLDSAWISTIHGFCARLLRRHAFEAGLEPGFAVADDTDAQQLREAAFDRASQDLHGVDDAVRYLFALYGFQQVWGAVSHLSRELETRGLTPDDIATEPTADPKVLFREAHTFFTQAEQELGRHAGSSKGAANHAIACRTVLERLEPLEDQQQEGSEVAERLWRALAGYSARGGSAGPIRDLCDSLTAERTRLLAAAVTLLAAPHAEALVRLTDAYLAALGELKEARGVLDFADLQLHADRLLVTRPDLRDRYRAGFRLVMVDEFQDTDELQLNIVRAVAGPNLCTVGDDRQSIYRFRGADLEVYRRHREEMVRDGARPVTLTENYRSHPEVIGFVNQVFGSAAFFGDDLLRLRAGRVEPDPPVPVGDRPRVAIDLVQATGIPVAESRRAEAEVLAERFSELRVAGIDPGDMVVLVRRYANADPIAAALRRRGFPVLVIGGRGFLALPEIGMIRALCRVVANPRDDTALAQLLLSPMSMVTDDGVWLLRNSDEAKASGRHLWDGLTTARAALDPEDATAAGELRDVIERARERSGSLSLGEVLMRAVEETGTDVALLSTGDEGLQAFTNVLRFARKADEFERDTGGGPASFTARIDAEERFGYRESASAVTDDGSPAVRIMSIHASKGLEFPVVALPMLGGATPTDTSVLRAKASVDQLEVALALPTGWGGRPEHRRSAWFERMRVAQTSEAAEEDKRLLYVACTRARELLILSGSADLSKDPADSAAETSLGLLRRALGDVLAGDPGAAYVREIGDGVRTEVRIHSTDTIPAGASPSANAAAATQREPRHAGESAGALRRRSGPEETQRAAAGIGPVRPRRLSYSDISVFESCPLRYWAQSVARLGEIAIDGPGDPMRFGSALHAALQVFGQESPKQVGRRLMSIARHHGLRPADEERLAHAVAAFSRSGVAASLAACGRVHRERPFAARITTGEHVFDLVGAMDAYGVLGTEALIVDYKSGRSGASSDELRDRYETQARCYALAALREGHETVKVVFVRPEVTDVDGQMESVAYAFTPADQCELERWLVETYERISATPYRPLDAWDDSVCRSCRISGSICPLTPPRRGAV